MGIVMCGPDRKPEVNQHCLIQIRVKHEHTRQASQRWGAVRLQQGRSRK